MAASSLQIVTLDLPNPSYSTALSYTRINSTVSFTYLLSTNIRTLSTNGASQSLGGLLYVPTLSDAACENATASYLPNNVTRLDNLPDNGAGRSLVALAPWTSPNCVLEYLHDARPDIVLFFLPGDNGTAEPPDMNDPVWGLGDGGSWKRSNGFPVYALPGQSAQILLEASSQYSGNMTNVPYGHRLTEWYDSRDFVRLQVDVDTGYAGGPASALPSLWVFLLVVLGILLAIIGFTSAIMHAIQYRRRQALRRRVANGDVDLEALGIKRLTVPQSLLDTMPLYTYGTGAPVASSSSRPTAAKPTVSTNENSKIDSPASSRPPSPAPVIRPTRPTRGRSYRPTPFQQPTCAICLDDFVPAYIPQQENSSSTAEVVEGTTVRSLPCHHIFHPECIDAFLLSTSSLCPMCKKSCLPRGYCPKNVTNAMVRRERLVRRIRPDGSEDVGGLVQGDWRRGGAFGVSGGSARDWRHRLWDARWRDLAMGVPRRGTAGDRATVPATSSTPIGTGQITEMTTPAPLAPLEPTNPGTPSPSSACPAPTQPASAVGRREWARQRAIALLGRQALPPDADADDEVAARSREGGWRKVVRGVFPGFGGRGR
ncbi:hypothetical protein LTR62_006441 [Meristemomyces frigidus]|uniref:RING-type domain-containing protein n=1 Tax=Meristemomyces frigidus TaxID=1508187 RepID=A0AAN7TJX4_9PEZI|nr:hypothetical protein LTR62_006441 [Meristemomyces frigidus]